MYFVWAFSTVLFQPFLQLSSKQSRFFRFKVKSISLNFAVQNLVYKVILLIFFFAEMESVWNLQKQGKNG